MDCLISFGSNLGDRERILERVLERLTQHPAFDQIVASRPQETSAVGGSPDQPPYLNAAIRLTADESPAELHQILMTFERDLGRQRRRRWGSRTIDLDLLLCGRHSIRSTELTIPHPRMSFRRFVLEPAVEIAPQMPHPVCRQTLAQLLERLDRSPNRILVVGQDLQEYRHACQDRVAARSTSDEAVFDQHESQSGESASQPGDWTVLWWDRAECPAEWVEQTKLLVSIHRTTGPSNQPGKAGEIDWRGPRLDLFRPTPEDLVIELNAAMQAMSRSYRHSPPFDVQ